MFIPVYRHSDPSRWGFDFEPENPNDPPACWSWVADGSALRLDPRSGRQLIFEPGKLSPRYAHELFFEDERRDDLPLSEPGSAGA